MLWAGWGYALGTIGFAIRGGCSKLGLRHQRQHGDMSGKMFHHSHIGHVQHTQCSILFIRGIEHRGLWKR